MDDLLISDEDLDTALAAGDPLIPGSVDSTGVAQALMELRAHVSTSAENTGPTPRTARRSRGRRSRRRLSLGFAAAVLVIVVSLAGLSSSGGLTAGSNWLMTVTPAQAAQINRVAAVTAQQAGPGKGQWLYQSYDTLIRAGLPWGSAYVSYHRASRTQRWASSQVQRYRTVDTQFAFTTPKDRATYLKVRSHLLPELTGGGPLKPGSVTDTASPMPPSGPDFPRYTPQNFPDTKLGILNRFKHLVAADEARMPKSKFEAQFKTQLVSGLFGVLVMILEQSTSSRQRAAAFAALAYVPNLQTLGDSTDVRGRTGLAIRSPEDAQVGDDSVETLIVDRRSGNLLQDTQESYGLRNHVSVTRTVYLERAIVPSMTAVPGGRSVPYRGPQPKLGIGTTTK